MLAQLVMSIVCHLLVINFDAFGGFLASWTISGFLAYGILAGVAVLLFYLTVFLD